MADIPVISHLTVDAKWLVKAELFRLPFLGWMLRMAGDIPVERSDRRKGARALLQCARSLRHGCSIVCFPEGTRSRDGQVLPFSEGPFQLAIREKVPILPLVVEGSAAALPRNSWILGGSHVVQLLVLKAVSVDGWDMKRSAALRDEVRRRIVDELRRLRVGRECSDCPTRQEPGGCKVSGRMVLCSCCGQPLPYGRGSVRGRERQRAVPGSTESRAQGREPGYLIEPAP